MSFYAGATMTTKPDPCTPLEERAAIIAEACGVSQDEAMRMAVWQSSLRSGIGTTTTDTDCGNCAHLTSLGMWCAAFSAGPMRWNRREGDTVTSGVLRLTRCRQAPPVGPTQTTEAP